MVNVIAHTKKSIPLRDTNGSFLAAALIIMIVLTAIGISLAGMVVAQYSKTQRITYSTGALYTAEAGIEQTLYQLNQNDSFAGFPTEQVFSNSNEFGRAVYTSSIKNLAGGNAKTITTTAKTYNYNNASKPVSTRKIRVTVVGTGSEGYSVHTGPGGLILGGSANITNSDVFVNGRITMSGAARIGTNAQPVKVDVANQACPMVSNPGASYPQVCESGQPIDLQWSTYIYGSVCATGQTSYGPNPSKNILPGSGGLGLQLGCTAAPVTAPSYDRSAHIARMSTTGSMSNSNYNCSQWRNPDAFTRTWPANLTLTGNVDLSSSCDLTITGDVYITGNLNIGGAAKIRVANSVGTRRPAIVVDGSVTVGGSAQMLANTSGTGMHFISFKSNAPCNPSCTTITGTALKNTLNLETVSVGGAGNLPGMVFQAYWGKIKLEIEPGTYLVANSGSLITSVQDIVDTGEEGYEFIKVDGGMTEIMRPALYGAQHPLIVVNNLPAEHKKYVVVGHCCESGDILTPYPSDPEAISERLLQKAQIGDFLVVEGTGAYCAYMSAQNYNSFPLRPEVMRTLNGDFIEICRRETLAEMLQLESKSLT